MDSQPIRLTRSIQWWPVKHFVCRNCGCEVTTTNRNRFEFCDPCAVDARLESKRRANRRWARKHRRKGC